MDSFVVFNPNAPRGRPAVSSECASARVSAVNQFPNLVVFEKFPAVRGGQTLFDLLNKPGIVVDLALHGFYDQRLPVAALFICRAAELCFQIRL
jgi:hypothetical protein